MFVKKNSSQIQNAAQTVLTPILGCYMCTLLPMNISPKLQQFLTFVSQLFYPCSSGWFGVGGAQLEKDNVTYFCAPIQIYQYRNRHLGDNLLTLICLSILHTVHTTES